MPLDLNRTANFATVVVALCAVVATASLVRKGAGRSTSLRSLDVRPDSVLVPEWERYLLGGHARGPASAPVTILEFGDYECPFCSRFAPVIDQILASYPSQVRFVYRHWPLSQHRFGYPAARAAECAAEQGRFWEMHALLYAKTDSLGLISFPDFAERAGVPDMREFSACNAKGGPVDAIENGIRDAHAAGGWGTPAVIVNGLLIRGGVDSAYIARLLSEQQWAH